MPAGATDCSIRSFTVDFGDLPAPANIVTQNNWKTDTVTSIDYSGTVQNLLPVAYGVVPTWSTNKSFDVGYA